MPSHEANNCMNPCTLSRTYRYVCTACMQRSRGESSPHHQDLAEAGSLVTAGAEPQPFNQQSTHKLSDQLSCFNHRPFPRLVIPRRAATPKSNGLVFDPTRAPQRNRNMDRTYIRELHPAIAIKCTTFLINPTACPGHNRNGPMGTPTGLRLPVLRLANRNIRGPGCRRKSARQSTTPSTKFHRAAEWTSKGL